MCEKNGEKETTTTLIITPWKKTGPKVLPYKIFSQKTYSFTQMKQLFLLNFAKYFRLFDYPAAIVLDERNHQQKTQRYICLLQVRSLSKKICSFFKICLQVRASSLCLRFWNSVSGQVRKFVVEAKRSRPLAGFVVQVKRKI